MNTRSKTTAALFALFLGAFGFHKFYLGETLAGVLFLLFSWTFIPAFIAFLECLQYLSMDPVKFDKMYNKHIILKK